MQGASTFANYSDVCKRVWILGMKKRAIITIDYNIPNGTIEEIAKKHELLSRFLKVFGEMDEQIVNKSMKLIDVNDDDITNVTKLKFQ